MSTEELLHQAIADQPEEDTPRLAFADWLDELGGEANATRAEFIRLQVGLYRANAETPETRAARRRAADLLERYRESWGFPAGVLRPRCVVRRGFVDELIVGGGWNQVGIPADVLNLLPRHPVTRLRFEGFRPGGPDVFETFEALEMAAFTKVRHVEVAGEQWIDELISRLLCLEHFPWLTSLSLLGTGLTPASVELVAGHGRLGSLASLRISFAGAYWFNPQQHAVRGVRDEGATRLAESPVLQSLRELSLRNTAIGSLGARALAESEGLGRLERLILTENPDIDPNARAALRERFGDRVFL